MFFKKKISFDNFNNKLADDRTIALPLTLMNIAPSLNHHEAVNLAIAIVENKIPQLKLTY